MEDNEPITFSDRLVEEFNRNKDKFKEIFDIDQDGDVDLDDVKAMKDDGTWILFIGILASMVITSFIDTYFPLGTGGFFGVLSGTSTPFIMLYSTRKYMNLEKFKNRKLVKALEAANLKCSELELEYNAYKQLTELKEVQDKLNHTQEMNTLKISLEVKKREIELFQETALNK